MNEQSLEGRDPIKYIIKPRPLIEDEQSIVDNIAYINLQASLFNHSEIKEDGSWVTPPSFNIIKNNKYANKKEVRFENIAKVGKIGDLDSPDVFLEFDCSQCNQTDISYNATIGVSSIVDCSNLLQSDVCYFSSFAVKSEIGADVPCHKVERTV